MTFLSFNPRLFFVAFAFYWLLTHYAISPFSMREIAIFFVAFTVWTRRLHGGNASPWHGKGVALPLARQRLHAVRPKRNGKKRLFRTISPHFHSLNEHSAKCWFSAIFFYIFSQHSKHHFQYGKTWISPKSSFIVCSSSYVMTRRLWQARTAGSFCNAEISRS